MRKFILIFAIVASLCAVSCGNRKNVKVDSEQVDSVLVDSVAVDSVAVDSVVVE